MLLLGDCQPASDKAKTNPTQPAASKNYIFFLHNRFLEEHDLDDADPKFGKVEYKKMIGAFQKDGFIVISEKRKPKTDVKVYAKKVVVQIDSLLQQHVRPYHITVIGTSKGGYIAQYVSPYLANPEVNYVFIGCFQDSDTAEIPDIQFCGNILSIYEKTDFTVFQ